MVVRKFLASNQITVSEGEDTQELTVRPGDRKMKPVAVYNIYYSCRYLRRQTMHPFSFRRMRRCCDPDNACGSLSTNLLRCVLNQCFIAQLTTYPRKAEQWSLSTIYHCVTLLFHVASCFDNSLPSTAHIKANSTPYAPLRAVCRLFDFDVETGSFISDGSSTTEEYVIRKLAS